MDAQMPTGYENYPRQEETEREAIVSGWQNPPAPTPMVRRYQGGPAYPPNPPRSSRRAALVTFVGAGVAGVIALSLWPSKSADSTDEPPEDYFDDPVDPFDPSSDEKVEASTLAFGGLDVDVPDGWTVMSDSDSRALLTHGHNRILIVSFEPDGQDAADELTWALTESDSGFSGTDSKIIGTQTSDFQRAVMTSTGKFEGKPARETAEVLMSADGVAAWYIEQILSAAKGSAIAEQSTRLAADLRDSWPW